MVMAERAGGGVSSGRLSDDDLAQLAGRIASLANAGLPLASGLRAGRGIAAGAASRRPEPRVGCLGFGDAIGRGADNARGTTPGSPPRTCAGGGRTGKVGEVLGRFAGYSNVGIDVRRALTLRLLYPFFAIAFAAAIFVFVCVVLASGISKIFLDFGIPVPLITHWVFAVSNAVSRVWWPLLQGVLGLASLALLSIVVLRADIRRSMYSALPLVGVVWHLTSLAEFCHLLALLLESEVPLDEALPMAGAGVDDHLIKSASQAAARAVAGGIVRRIRNAAVVVLTRLRSDPCVGRKHHGLPEALHMSGDMFLARAKGHANFVSTLCSVLSILSILAGVATTILAVVIPLIQLISKLSG